MNNIKKNATAIVSIVALFLGVAAPSVQAAPSAEMCRTLPKSEPWKIIRRMFGMWCGGTKWRFVHYK
jgi:hypothetical protein